MRDKRLFKRVDRAVGVPLLRLLGLFRGRALPPPLAPGSRVLVIKFSALGDTLLLLPLLKALREAVGRAGRLEVVATPVNVGALEGLPWLDAVHVVRPGDFLARPWRLARLALRLRRARFDWALDFDQWLRSTALLAWISGARGRAGFRAEGQDKHHAFHAWVENRRDRHEFGQFKDVAALAGLEPSRVEPYHGFLLRWGLLGAGTAAPVPERLVLIHPGAGGDRSWQREWPPERWAELGRRLRGRGWRVALSGHGPREEALCAAIALRMGGPPDEACLSAGLPALVGLLRRAELLACGNTGVMHLAAGLGRPVLALHGPTSSVKWGPLADAEGSAGLAVALSAHVPCSPCLSLGFEYGCPARPCMESIGVDEAEAAALRILERT